MIVEAPSAEGTTVSAVIRRDDGTAVPVSYELDQEPARVAVDPFVVAAVLPAMRLGEPIRCALPVSSRLLRGIARIQEIQHVWDDGFRRVPIDAPMRTDAGPRGSEVTCLFSAGVDSFYSVHKHRNELTSLLFIDGIDVQVEQAAMREQVASAVAQAAADLDLPLIEVTTNVRELSDPIVPWDAYHGSALAGVGLALAGRVGQLIVPASLTFANLVPWGSHPLLDPLWSTEEVDVVHDGCEATRLDKLAAIADDPAARRWLRVCWEVRGGAYNCGQCEKCLRTMVGLRALGRLDEFPTFPPLDLDRVADAHALGSGFTWKRILRHVEATGADPQLARAIRRALRPRRPLEQLGAQLSRLRQRVLR